VAQDNRLALFAKKITADAFCEFPKVLVPRNKDLISNSSFFIWELYRSYAADDAKP
jgi:hypothetical protein